MKYSSLSAEELVKACADAQNVEAWEEFARRFRKLISVVVLRVARQHKDYTTRLLEDLIQNAYLKICANNCSLLRNFQPQHPDALYGMIKVTAANATHDYYRVLESDKRNPGTPEIDLSEVEDFVADVHFPGAARIERAILIQQIDDILARNDSPTAARDREIFWLYYRQGLTAKEIASIKHYQLGVKGAESVLQRLGCIICRALAQQPEPPEQPPLATAKADRLEGNSSRNPLDQEEGQT